MYIYEIILNFQKNENSNIFIVLDNLWNSKSTNMEFVNDCDTLESRIARMNMAISLDVARQYDEREQAIKEAFQFQYYTKMAAIQYQHDMDMIGSMIACDLASMQQTRHPEEIRTREQRFDEELARLSGYKRKVTLSGKTPNGMKQPDEKFGNPDPKIQAKHKGKYIPAYVDGSVARKVDSHAITIPDGTPIYSNYTRALVGYWPIPFGIKCDAKVGQPNFGGYFHAVILNEDAGEIGANGKPTGEYHIHRTSPNVYFVE